MRLPPWRVQSSFWLNEISLVENSVLLDSEKFAVGNVVKFGTTRETNVWIHHLRYQPGAVRQILQLQLQP
jgi:hypothetical protein